MTAYLSVPLLCVLALIQTSAIPHLTVWGVFPDLPMLAVASWGILRGAREGAAWGLVAGLAIDLLSGAPMGAGSAGLIVVGLLSGVAGATAFRGYAVLPVAVALVATVAYDLSFLVVGDLSGRNTVWGQSLLRIVLPSAVLNALLAPLAYWMARRLQARFGRKEMEW